MRDRVALADQLLTGAGHAIELVGKRARAGVGRAGQHRFLLGVVQGVVEPRDAARGIAERRMSGDVLHPLAVDVDLAAVSQAFQVFLAGEGRAAPISHLLASAVPLLFLAALQPSAPISRHVRMFQVASTTSSVTGHRP